MRVLLVYGLGRGIHAPFTSYLTYEARSFITDLCSAWSSLLCHIHARFRCRCEDRCVAPSAVLSDVRIVALHDSRTAWYVSAACALCRHRWIVGLGRQGIERRNRCRLFLSVHVGDGLALLCRALGVARGDAATPLDGGCSFDGATPIYEYPRSPRCCCRRRSDHENAQASQSTLSRRSRSIALVRGSSGTRRHGRAPAQPN